MTAVLNIFAEVVSTNAIYCDCSTGALLELAWPGLVGETLNLVNLELSLISVAFSTNSANHQTPHTVYGLCFFIDVQLRSVDFLVCILNQ
jgi:hypothetical protein